MSRHLGWAAERCQAALLLVLALGNSHRGSVKVSNLS